VAFFRRLRAKVDLPLPTTGPLGPAALRLSAVQANDHPQMLLRQGDGINRRPGDAGARQQFRDRAVHDLDHFFTRQVVGHWRDSWW
jgi:hypothetical protein